MRRIPLLAFLVFAACSPKTPIRWRELGLPTEGLETVYRHTDEHGFYADYSGYTAEDLMNTVTRALEDAGYSPACNAFEGRVQGFRRGHEELVVKVDLLGSVVGLSLFDENGSDPLVHGVCFGRYRLGPEQRIR